MLSLLNAIYSTFTGSGALVAAFSGGMHRDQAPENTAMPYLVSHVVSSKLEYSYGGACRSDTQVKFSAIGVGHDATGALIESLIDEFDDRTLSLEEGENDTVTRLGDALAVLLRHDARGDDVWEWSVTYEYGVTL